MLQSAKILYYYGACAYTSSQYCYKHQIARGRPVGLACFLAAAVREAAGSMTCTQEIYYNQSLYHYILLCFISVVLRSGHLAAAAL
jgi:hypothetical protein